MARASVTLLAAALLAAVPAAAAAEEAVPPADCAGGVCPADHVLLQRGHHHETAKVAHPPHHGHRGHHHQTAEDEDKDADEDHGGEQPAAGRALFSPRATSGTLLEAGSAAAAASATMRPATAAERKEFVDTHNMYRCMHGAPAVKWSDAVAADVVSYVSPMTQMKHSQSYNIKPPAGPAGENIYWSSGSGTAANAVKAWYNEVNDCNGGPSGFTDGCARGKGTTGHFTAMIWAGVKEIGCGFSNSKAPTVILCRYKAGNSLSSDTPNMNKNSGNYKNQVFTRKKSESQCGGSSSGGGSSSSPSSPSTKYGSSHGGAAKACTSTDTGGSCGWLPCWPWRKAKCESGHCKCKGNTCAVGGKCVPGG